MTIISKESRVLFLESLIGIWRNTKLFENDFQPPHCTIEVIFHYTCGAIKRHGLALSLLVKLTKTSFQIGWSKLVHGWIKLNTNDASKGKQEPMAAGAAA